jgi:hypothetical protein
VEPITTSNQLLLLEAIDRVRKDVDAPRLPFEELTETTFTLVAEHMRLLLGSPGGCGDRTAHGW